MNQRWSDDKTQNHKISRWGRLEDARPCPTKEDIERVRPLICRMVKDAYLAGWCLRYLQNRAWVWTPGGRSLPPTWMDEAARQGPTKVCQRALLLALQSLCPYEVWHSPKAPERRSLSRSLRETQA